MIALAINLGLLVWVASSYRKLKHDVLVALLFGTAKAGLIVAFSTNVIPQVGWLPVILVALVKGLVSFIACWAFMALLGRTDRLEFAHRRAIADGQTPKKPMRVLEWLGILLSGLVCTFV